MLSTALFVLGRIILGGYFLMNAYNHMAHSAALSGYAASKNVPSPKLAVLGSGLLLLIGGIGILFGVFVPFAVAAIALFLIPVTFMMHAFWKMSDPMAKMAEQISFMKNMAILGATLMLLMIPEPWMYSL